MNLDEHQKKQIAAWMEEGLKLSEIQNRLASELGLKLTYMEVRFLVDDLKLTPKEEARPEPEKATAPKTDPGQPANPLGHPAKGAPEAAASAGVSVSVDTLMKPGTLVSGRVTFSDGQTAEWYLDQMGQLGLVPKKEGYRPTPADVRAFQAALEREIHGAGL